MKAGVSLKSALLRSLILPLLAYIVIIGGAAYVSAVRSIDQVYDANLITVTNILYYLTQRELLEADNQDLAHLAFSDEYLTPEEKAIFRQSAEWHAFRIWHGNTLVMMSGTAMPETVPAFPDGFSEKKYNNQDWRVYTLTVPDKHISVEAAEQLASRRYLVGDIVRNMLLPFLLSLPLALWLFSRALEHGLLGFRRVTGQINTRSPEALTPLSASGVPTDIVPLVEAINSLLGRLSSALERERQLTDNAAHQLRTPLAALKLQTQMALRTSIESERQKTLTEILASVDRASHAVDQLLALARVNSQVFDLEPVDIVPIMQKLCAALTPLAEQRSMKIALLLPESLCAKANQPLLEMAFTNILDNAIKYSPKGSTVYVTAEQDTSKIKFSVEDQGPGIPLTEQDRVFTRFYRLEGTESNGTGLGLTIVKQSVERMGGIVRLSPRPNGSGLNVAVLLNAA